MDEEAPKKKLITMLRDGDELVFRTSRVESVVEILSSPLFYRLRRLVAGEQAKGKWENIV